MRGSYRRRQPRRQYATGHRTKRSSTNGRSLQFRLEAFNLFNEPVWGDPQMSMASPLYGTINTTRTPMRELQIVITFAF